MSRGSQMNSLILWTLSTLLKCRRRFRPRARKWALKACPPQKWSAQKHSKSTAKTKAWIKWAVMTLTVRKFSPPSKSGDKYRRRWRWWSTTQRMSRVTTLLLRRDQNKFSLLSSSRIQCSRRLGMVNWRDVHYLPLKKIKMPNLRRLSLKLLQVVYKWLQSLCQVPMSVATERASLLRT